MLISNQLYLYNTLGRKKELFVPIHSPFVGMYVCGPTVYGEAHLGHARSAVTFDILFRYLTFLGYKVRYVRNITDVGHLLNDADEGEDKLQKKAKVENLEPMEVAQKYSNSYHEDIRLLNVLSPSIEPRATGHIPEQIEAIESIIEQGFAYEQDGSVYFDVEKYNQSHNYGVLSGRKLEELMAGAGNERRKLEGAEQKKHPGDFALWKKASEEHLMRWKSPWSDGFPGWHIECSAMSAKYLGKEFDIHGGGMDLLFPHHECEISQNEIMSHNPGPRFWVHHNMVTVNGRKMGKSLNNSILLKEFFEGNHELLTQAFSPMSIRFFILQAHYRSVVDFSDEALKASEKGLHRLLDAIEVLKNLKSDSDINEVDIKALQEACTQAMNDDLNTPIVISELFQFIPTIHKIQMGDLKISPSVLTELQSFVSLVVNDWLGIHSISVSQDSQNNDLQEGLINCLLDIRVQAKADKNYDLSDKIRNQLESLGVIIKDLKDKTIWELKK